MMLKIRVGEYIPPRVQAELATVPEQDRPQGYKGSDGEYYAHDGDGVWYKNHNALIFVGSPAQKRAFKRLLLGIKEVKE